MHFSLSGVAGPMEGTGFVAGAALCAGELRRRSAAWCPRVGAQARGSGRASLRRRLVVRSALDPLVLTEENVEQALVEAKATLETIFDSPENNEVGITGNVEFVSLEGPAVVLRLKGRFWHKREDVLLRVANYLQSRIPEIFEVDIEDPRQLEDSEEESARLT